MYQEYLGAPQLTCSALMIVALFMLTYLSIMHTHPRLPATVLRAIILLCNNMSLVGNAH